MGMECGMCGSRRMSRAWGSGKILIWCIQKQRVGAGHARREGGRGGWSTKVVMGQVLGRGEVGGGSGR
jgi:hypothetical protein